MELFNRDEVKINRHRILKKINDGKLFIYPTDTIYGIGCDATNEESVSRLRKIKGNHANPLSVIAPSFEWIKEHCHIDGKWMKKIPGPYTLVMKLKKDIPKVVNNGSDSVGVRMPNHWITEFLSNSKTPIITTSANKNGEDFMTSIENLDDNIKSQVDFIIYEGEIKGRPSTLVHLEKDEVKIKKR